MARQFGYKDLEPHQKKALDLLREAMVKINQSNAVMGGDDFLTNATKSIDKAMGALWEARERYAKQCEQGLDYTREEMRESLADYEGKDQFVNRNGHRDGGNDAKLESYSSHRQFDWP